VEFEKGEICCARDYRNPNKITWKKSIVEEIMDKIIYFVRNLEEHIIWKRHLDQLIKAGNFYRDPEQ